MCMDLKSEDNIINMLQKTYKNIIQIWNNAVANQDIKIEDCPYINNVERRILKEYGEE